MFYKAPFSILHIIGKIYVNYKKCLNYNEKKQTIANYGLQYVNIQVNNTRNGNRITVHFSHSVMSYSLLPHGLQHARLP